MSLSDVFQVAAAVVASFGGAAVVIAAFSSWLGRVWAARILEKDRLKYSTALSNFESELDLERLKNATQFSTLHERRAEFLAELYARMYDLYGAVVGLLHEYEFRAIREEIDNKYDKARREPWEMKAGIDTLSRGEEESVAAVRDAARELQEFFKRRRLYFPAHLCEKVDQFALLSGHVASSYNDVVYKDEDGSLVVHESVKESWDRAVEAIPEILSSIEVEFRSILGVEK